MHALDRIMAHAVGECIDDCSTCSLHCILQAIYRCERQRRQVTALVLLRLRLRILRLWYAVLLCPYTDLFTVDSREWSKLAVDAEIAQEIASLLTQSMRAMQVSRATPSEPRKGSLRWAFPGLFLQEKGVWKNCCRVPRGLLQVISAARSKPRLEALLWDRRCLEWCRHLADHSVALWR